MKEIFWWIKPKSKSKVSAESVKKAMLDVRLVACSILPKGGKHQPKNPRWYWYLRFTPIDLSAKELHTLYCIDFHTSEEHNQIFQKIFAATKKLVAHKKPYPTHYYHQWVDFDLVYSIVRDKRRPTFIDSVFFFQALHPY